MRGALSSTACSTSLLSGMSSTQPPRSPSAGETSVSFTEQFSVLDLSCDDGAALPDPDSTLGTTCLVAAGDDVYVINPTRMRMKAKK